MNNIYVFCHESRHTRESLGLTETHSRQMAFCPKAQREIKYVWMCSPFVGLKFLSECDVIKMEFTGDGGGSTQEDLDRQTSL